MHVIEHTSDTARREFRRDWCLAWERIYGAVPRAVSYPSIFLRRQAE